jgi:hypothetical protein
VPNCDDGDPNTVDAWEGGTCVYYPPDDGTPCDDGDPETLLDVYSGGVCQGVPWNTVDHDGDGYSVADGDCDDTNPAVHPGATEIENGIDDNCDGDIDEGFGG